MMHTQIGGKYHPDDRSIFRLKRLLSDLDVTVAHPLANAIQVCEEGRAFAFDPHFYAFHTVERHYYECIRACDFHAVCNQFREDLGYVGGSASLEMAYAMCHAKPIVVLHPISFNAAVNADIRNVVAARQHQLIVHDFLNADIEDSRIVLDQLRNNRPDYSLTNSERKMIDGYAEALLASLINE